LRNNSLVGYAFSIDVEDLFYSVPHEEMYRSVLACIEASGVVAFQNASGIPLDSFMALLEFYLRSTFVSFNDKLFIQRKGICIGSCVAPVLCNIFLANVDRDLNGVLNADNVLKVFRYVDDFLVLLKTNTSVTHLNMVQSVLADFRQHGKGLLFTHELPDNNQLQFLDINITINEQHACWMYRPRARKELLPFDSAHSKTVKRAIATSCLESALLKSCDHQVDASFKQQISRLEEAGFPCSVLVSIAETALQKMKGRRRKDTTRQRTKRPEVIPYVHKLAHNLKKVANKYDVPVVFSAPKKLAGLCSRISDEKAKRPCDKKHATPYVDCSVGVVYEIPLSCGKVYIGQTGRCINDRAREHALSVKNKYGSHLPVHCNTCGCVPGLRQVRILGRSRETVARELLEAYYIKKSGTACVSETSILLHGSEFQFLSERMLS
ncbi:unnamed protein product, partial [Ixodes hexagonus]